jgi:hypothetical protein
LRGKNGRREGQQTYNAERRHNGSGGALIIIDHGKLWTNVTESLIDILDMSTEGVECFWKPIAQDFVAEAGFNDVMNNGVQT